MHVRKILLVDDDSDIRRIGMASLACVGKWEVKLAASGAEAVALAISFQPDLILLDVMMPDLDGPATLKRLRAEPDTAALPVVFLTALHQPDEVAHLKSLGALGVVRKPFDPMTLPSLIRSLV